MARPIAATLCALSIALAAPLAAADTPDYGWGSYDETTTLVATGPLDEVEWMNPYSQAHITYRGRTWVVVLAPMTRMNFRGLTRDKLLAAREVTLIGYARTDGAREMRIKSIVLDGEAYDMRP